MLEDVEVMLRGRARDIVLSNSLRDLYLATSWGQRKRIARSWLGWVSIVSVGVSGLNCVLHRELLRESLLMLAIFIPILHAALAHVWSRPRSSWIEGLTVPIAIIALMTAGGVLGVYAGGLRLHDNLGVVLFASTTAIVIFPVTLTWTVIGAITAVAAYTGFGLLDPIRGTREILVYATAFALVTGCLIPARNSINTLLQHAFLLTLRGLLQGRALEDANLRLAVLATTDALTGLPNRRAFEEAAARLWLQPGVNPPSIGIVMLDIDHFKCLNDTAGHASGDRCLAAVAGAIRACLTNNGMAARYGGEEFICIIPDATAENLGQLADALRASIEAMSLSNPGLGQGGIVTVSAGAALALPGGGLESLAILIGRADSALYQAKSRGRNQTVTALTPLAAERPEPEPRAGDRLCA